MRVVSHCLLEASRAYAGVISATDGAGSTGLWTFRGARWTLLAHQILIFAYFCAISTTRVSVEGPAKEASIFRIAAAEAAMRFEAVRYCARTMFAGATA